mmetsp:Transcript_8318/g.21300  ORF Transcript_8318/g.21300 Transcript_8318/m.21300 type:complete len:209 (-) Transcript_8318:912-1538(-)
MCRHLLEHTDRPGDVVLLLRKPKPRARSVRVLLGGLQQATAAEEDVAVPQLDEGEKDVLHNEVLHRQVRILTAQTRVRWFPMDIQRADQLGAVAQELTQARRILLQRRVDAAYELLLEASKAPEDQRVLVKAYELGERIAESATDEPRDARCEIIVKKVARGPFFFQRAGVDETSPRSGSLVEELRYTDELLLAHLPALRNELGAIVC